MEPPENRFLQLLFEQNIGNQSGQSIGKYINLPYFQPIEEPTKCSENYSMKIVLLWTPFFGPWQKHFENLNGDTIILDNDCNRQCHFTTDRSKLVKSNAVIFHGRDINLEDLPQKRLHFQYWIYFILESPLNANNAEAFHEALHFNWTMSYSGKSDIFTPYGSMRIKPNVPLETKQKLKAKIEFFIDGFSSRPKDAIFITSHCRFVFENFILF